MCKQTVKLAIIVPAAVTVAVVATIALLPLRIILIAMKRGKNE